MSALLRSPQTAFLIVTSPEPEPAREARFLAERLAEAGMARAELIVNRVHSDGLDGQRSSEVAALLRAQLGAGLAARVARNLADFDVLARRDARRSRSLVRPLGGRADDRGAAPR